MGTGKITLEQWNKILELQNYRCNDCGRKFTKKLKPTEDHIVPLSKNGRHDFENLQALCLPCNIKKNDKLDKEYITVWVAEGVSG